MRSICLWFWAANRQAAQCASDDGIRFVLTNPPASSNPIAPITGPAASVGYSNNFHAGSVFPINQQVRVLAKHNPARSEFEGWKLLRVLRNLLYCPAEFIQEAFRGALTALRVPVCRRLRLLKCRRVDVDGSARHRSSRAQRRRRASPHGISLTAPLSIC
jgi:hypothetical protein